MQHDIIEAKYMASWLDEDPVITLINELPKMPVWNFWDGESLIDGMPPKRVKILLTGLMYKWEDFQKIRTKKKL
jgi:hypothetical protein